MPALYLLHPMAVHYPIALLTAGLAAAVVDGAARRRWGWPADAASWLLWLGTASAGVAAGLGCLAKRTAPHVPPAWQTLALHQTLAYWTLGLFAILSLWRFFFRERRPLVFLLAWLIAAGVLLATGYQGGELVFTHNMGTSASAGE